jgi:hypothetical protein
MMNSGTIQSADQPFFHMREALVEAKLITQKRAGDAVYVTTLAEELRDIEAKIIALEDAGKSGPSTSGSAGPEPVLHFLPDAEWIHSKACELDARLRRLQPASVEPKVTASLLDGTTDKR